MSFLIPRTVSSENDDVSAENPNREPEMLNYGLTIASKGQEDRVSQLDRVLDKYSCFSVQTLGNWPSELDWPRNQIIVLVLDDSDDGHLQTLIKDEVSSWKEKGVNIVYRHRLIRTGYKAGNLMQGNPEVGLVQAWWGFENRDENLLRRLQNINLCFHFEVEQQVNGVFLNFFGFNGTAGVWRAATLEDSGGWLERTTVEDMHCGSSAF